MFTDKTVNNCTKILMTLLPFTRSTQRGVPKNVLHRCLVKINKEGNSFDHVKFDFSWNYIVNLRCSIWFLVGFVLPNASSCGNQRGFRSVWISGDWAFPLIVPTLLRGEELYTQMGFFVPWIFAARYIHRRELRLVSLESLSSVEYEIKKIFLIFVFYRELSRFKLLRKEEWIHVVLIHIFRNFCLNFRQFC